MRKATGSLVLLLALVVACDDGNALPTTGDGAAGTGMGDGAAGAGGGGPGSDAGALMGDAPRAGTGGAAGAGGTVAGAGGTAAVDCAFVAKSFCGAVDRCANLFVRTAYGDVATCEARFKIACQDESTSPGSGYTAQAVNICFAAIAAASCADLLDNKVTGCTIAGMRANGAACGGNSQCASSYCQRSALCGQCAPRPMAGDNCNENGDCQVGLVCAGAAGKKRCAVPAQPGTACSDKIPCVFGHYCKQGICAQVAGPGEPCAGEGSCDGIQALFCNEVAKTCQKATFVVPGDQCGIVNGGFAACTGGGHCAGFDPGTLKFTGVCASPAKDGEACGANGRVCLAPAACVGGVCKLPSSVMCQ